jgi:4-amino-4-deoxy-L-arabinose transferase-like glycosyltransferase
MPWSDRLSPTLILVLIIAAYLLAGTLYAVYTPAWQAPDEPAHYNYVSYLAEKGRLPVLRQGDYPHDYLEKIKSARFPPDMSVEPIRYEFWQPPLYYVLATSIYRLFNGVLLPLRLLSVALGMGVVMMAYAIALAIRPGDYTLALGAAAFVAFVPMHLTMMASVNNDALAELLLAVIMLRLIRFASGRPDRDQASSGHIYLAVTGLLLGLGLVTKATVYVAIPLALVALLLRRERKPALLAGGALALFGPALALSIPWYVRNVLVYGWPDLLGMRNHGSVVVGQLRTGDYLASVGWVTYLKNFVSTTFYSFWGQFGWMAVPMDRKVYLVLGLLSGLAVAGCILIAWRARRMEVGELAGVRNHAGPRFSGLPILPAAHVSLVVLWLILTGLVYVYYNISLVQFQGRYLFPTLVPIGLLGIVGLREILSRRWAWVAAGACGIAALIVGVGGILGGRLDKWALLFTGGATLVLAARRYLPDRLDGWILVTPLAGLAGLSVYSVFAFIVPYLRP